MSQRKREEERIERIIRGLLKLPENRRCINCNHLGPQYVCTTFLTFVCTTCSGVHREFSHRVKSVSMAKFKSEEVTALQAAGNERARQIYFKAWDPECNTHPDGSNIHKLRDFIKHVYVERKYTGARRFDMHTIAKSGDKGNFFEKHFIQKSGLGSREDFYERRYHERSSPSGRSDRNHRDYIDAKDSKFFSKGQSPDSIYERYETRRSRSAARFEIVDNRNQNDRYGRRSESFRILSSDTSMSPEPQKRREKTDPVVLELQRITEKAILPVLRPLEDIMGENPPTLNVGERPKENKAKDANGAAYDQKIALSDSHGSADAKADDNKAASASGLIESDNKFEDPDTSAKAQRERGSSIQSSTVQKICNPPSVNSVEFLLFELLGSPVGNTFENPCSNAASSNAPTTSPVASSTKSLALSIVPTASLTAPVPVDSSTEPVTSSAGAATSESASTPKTLATAAASSSVGNAQTYLFNGVYSLSTAPVPKASSTEPATSATGAATTESASTPKTLATPAGEAAAASSSLGNAQTHSFKSVTSLSRVSEEKKVQTTQQHQPSASPAGNINSTGSHGTPTFDAFSDQPWPSLPAPIAQKAPGNASADQSSQAVSKAAQTTSSAGNESKSTGRKELPAELFTFSYPTYPAPINNWEFRPPYRVGYGMQYAPSPNVTAFPGPAKSRNPFDLGDDPRPVQGAMLSSIATFPEAIPQMSPHAGLQPQGSPFASRLPPESPSYGMYMSTGGYMGPQLPNNTPNPRPQGTGSFGGNDDGGTAFTSLNPVRHSSDGYSSNLTPTASNSFSSAGGNPFA